DARDFAAETVAIDCKPVRHGSNLREIKVAQRELPRFGLVLDRNFVACFHIIGSNVHAASVHEHVPMRHELARGAARVSESKPVDNIIESRFQQLEKRFTGYTTLAQRTLENAPELFFKQSVLVAQLLFFAESNRVIRLLAPGTSRAVYAGWIILALQCFRRPEERHAVTPAYFCFWSCVSGHFGKFIVES